MNALPKHPKHISLEDAIQKRKNYKENRANVVLTNGCFDLLHLGHLYYLQEAKKLGDVLIVALNSSESIQKLKGPNRPVQGDLERGWGLGALQSVDWVITFNETRLVNEINQLKPDIYTKAGDYTFETLNKEEKKALENVGAKIHFIPFIEGFSTTKLIKKITEAYKNNL